MVGEQKQERLKKTKENTHAHSPAVVVRNCVIVKTMQKKKSSNQNIDKQQKGKSQINAKTNNSNL